MSEDVKLVIEELKESCIKSIDHVNSEFKKIRAGKAMPDMLNSVMVEYYGSKVPLNQVGNVNTPDARTLIVKPFEKSVLQEIEKGIMYANLGLNPQNDGEQVIINVPALTEERRLSLVKNAKSEVENGKIGLRSARKDALDMIKDLKNDGLSEDECKSAEDDVQKTISHFTKELEDLFDAKEKEILTI
jgi:ribosome recycling factor